jgi:DNA-binding NtrC family response regulator
MNTTEVLPTRFRPDSNLAAESDTPSNTQDRPNSPHQDHPPTMLLRVDSSPVKLLTLRELCDWYIERVLIQCGGKRKDTARALGIGRTSLYRYLKKSDREKRDGDWPQ